MKKIVWIVIAIIVAGTGYLAGVWFTANKTAEVLDQRVEQLSALTDYSAEVEWVEQGLFRSEFEIRVQASDLPEMFPAEISERVVLRHGFLNSEWQGEADFTFRDFILSEQLLDEHRIQSKGVIGAGGLSLTYTLPAIAPKQAWGFSTEMQPLTLQVIATDNEAHFELNVPELTALEPAQGDNDPVVISHVQNSQVIGSFRLENGRIASQQVITKMDRFEMLGDFGFMKEGFYLEMLSDIRGDLFDLQVNSHVERIALDDISLSYNVELLLENLDYAAVQPLRDRTDIDLAQQFIYDETDAFLLGEDPKLTIKKLHANVSGWGELEAIGILELATSDIERSERRTVLQDPQQVSRLSADVHLQKAPMMVLLMFMGVTSDELPWHFELNDGQLMLNGRVLEDLPVGGL